MTARLVGLTAVCAVVALWCASCGGSPPPEPTIFNLSVDIKPLHVCEMEISSPDEAVARVEEVRALPEDEFLEHCDLNFVATISEWHMLPLDLLGRIVHRAAQEGDLKHWVVKNGPSFPTAVADIVAIDIISRWRVGDSPAAVSEGAEYWEAQCKRCRAPEENSRRIPIAWVIENTQPVLRLLTKLNRVHELRCTVETTDRPLPLTCERLHKEGKRLSIRWKSRTGHLGRLESLQVTKCSGRSCRRIKRATKTLNADLKKLIRRIDRLKVSVYRERLSSLLVLEAPANLPLTEN